MNQTEKIKIRSQIEEFIINNGWELFESDEDFELYAKKDSIGVDVGNDEVVLIGECGDCFHIQYTQHTLYTLLGTMLHNLYLHPGYKWIEETK